LGIVQEQAIAAAEAALLGCREGEGEEEEEEEWEEAVR